MCHALRTFAKIFKNPDFDKNLADARAVSFRSTLKPKEKVTPPKAGNKHAKFIDKETERLKKIKIKQKDMETQAFRFKEKGKKVGDRMYDDNDIWQMLGFRKVTKTQSGRDMSGRRLPPKEISTYEKYSPLKDNQKETKKSLDNLLIVLRESDDVIIKEDVGIILESLNKTQRKTLWLWPCHFIHMKVSLYGQNIQLKQ